MSMIVKSGPEGWLKYMRVPPIKIGTNYMTPYLKLFSGGFFLPAFFGYRKKAGGVLGVTPHYIYIKN